MNNEEFIALLKLSEEDYAQITISDFCAVNNIPFYHFANERKCGVVQGKILKRKGVKKGVADCFLPRPSQGQGFSGLWIELKIYPRKATIEQVEFLVDRRAEGYEALLIAGKNSIELADKAIQAICDFYGI